MSAVLKSSTGVSVAESVLNDIVSKNSRYYYYLGKILSWNPLGVDLPETPDASYQYELKTRSQIISTKRIRESDVAFVIPKISWTVNTLYDIYDDAYSVNILSANGKSTLEDALFYVVTDEFNVYKCISNNYNMLSTVKPTGYDSGIVTTADGYQWKFMYNIPIGFKNKFFDAEFMPVTTAIKNNFYSKGQLSNVIIDNGGSNYIQSTTNIIVTGDGYIEENPYNIAGIAIGNAGFGYTTTPTATISSPLITIGAYVQATGVVVRTGSYISSGNITLNGYGYTNSASIVIDEPILNYTVFSPITAVSLNQNIKYLNNYYTVTTAGLLSLNPPTHTSGSAPNGTATLSYIATIAQAYLLFTKTEAVLTPIVNVAGQISGAIIRNSGIGYTYANISVVGAGTGAQLSIDLSSGDLNTLQANVELLAVDGALSYIKVESIGVGYTNATVVITGDGSGATATATLLLGNVVNIIITNYGIGYTYANASIVGNGSGCILRAIMSPKGGHGKNSILELHARTLMFFTTISNEKNQGIFVLNDSRQLGIIKSVNRFGTQLSFRNDLGSACYLLQAPVAVDQSKFYPDLLLKTGQKEYYVVSVQNDKILIVAQKNHIPVFGDVFTSVAGDSVNPILITPPSIDKYSGNLLFIDNRSAFTTSSQQSLSLRTTIGF